MGRKGIGARIAWSIESKRVMKDLANVFDGYPLQLVEFEEGGGQRDAVLAAYASARLRGSLISQSFSDSAALLLGFGQALASLGADDQFNVILQDSERKGIYRSTKTALIDRADQLLEYDGNSVIVATLNGLHGVLLDLEDGGSEAAVFELESW